MTYLEKLLDGADVEWMPLGEVYKFQYGKGNTIPSSGGNYPVYGSNGIVGKHTEYNSEDSPVIGHIGAYAGIVNWGEGKHFVTYNGVICTLTNRNVNSRYAFYQLLKQNFNALSKNSSQPFVSYKELNSVQIPIPPLEIQQQIVAILDKFSTLEAELEAELEARKKQYAFYREELLTFGEEVEWKTLGEVTIPTNNIRWKENNSTYRYIDLSSVSRENKNIVDTIKIDASNAPSRAQKIVVENDVIFATTRPTLQRYTMITSNFNGEIASTGYCILRANSTIVLPKWVYYNIASAKFNFYVEENQSGSAYPAISDTKVKDFSIPIPPLKEQERIVSILDKFDTLTTSISEGLPKELELRRKQYEYYRDMLLTFPKDNIES